jgi:hypothetical protein
MQVSGGCKGWGETRLRANLNPYTGAPFFPEHNTEKKTNNEGDESVPIQGVKKKCDDYEYSGDEKVSVHHHVRMYERASMKALKVK